jgi:hypothetical protein
MSHPRLARYSRADVNVITSCAICAPKSRPVGVTSGRIRDRTSGLAGAKPRHPQPVSDKRWRTDFSGGAQTAGMDPVEAWLRAQPPLNPMPPRVRGEVQRILDGEARRLLRERLDADAAAHVRTAHVATDDDTPDGGADQSTLRAELERLPVRRTHARRTAQRP